MLRFGNFRFAYKELSNKDRKYLEKIFESFCRIPSTFSKRPTQVLDIEKIEKNKTWYLGYISGKKVNREAEVFDDLESCGKIDGKEFKHKLEEMKKEIEQTLKTAFSNTDVYLTWDYIDVYVATSMRNRWEFEETYDFVDDLSKEKVVEDLRLRFFDPTQSACGNPRDKGLIEGLMLKRTAITVYMAQV